MLCLLLLLPLAQAQQLVMDKLTELAEELKENSGLLNLNGTLITHHDSDGEASLFEIDPQTGAVTRTVAVTNAENQDWEDIAQDQQYIYIGDIGNNTGSRTDLKIYRIRKSAYAGSSNTVTAEVIAYSYPDQTDFSPSTITHFDAEALMVLNDSLYIFTKNWENGRSALYSLPKTPGSYQGKKIGEFDTQGLVTGGTYNAAKEEIMLIGYTPLQAFAFRISGFSGNNVMQGTTERFELVLGLSSQIEGICPSNDNGYFISSEGNLGSVATLYHLSFGTTTRSDAAIPEPPLLLYPNPAREWLQVQHDKKVLTEIFDAAGRKHISTSHSRINLAHLRRGIYLVRVIQENGELVKTEKVLIE